MSCAPVLMYHQIVANEPGDVHAVKIESFADQMRWLYDRGFHSASVLMLRPECPRPASTTWLGWPLSSAART